MSGTHSWGSSLKTELSLEYVKFPSSLTKPPIHHVSEIGYSAWTLSVRHVLHSLSRRTTGRVCIQQVYSSPRAAVTNYHRLSDWQLQEFILVPFWRPEVKNQGASRIGVWWELSPWFTESCLPTVCSHGLCSVHMDRVRESKHFLVSFLLRTLILLVKAPSVWPHLTLVTS